jgi:hypothetical protein
MRRKPKAKLYLRFRTPDGKQSPYRPALFDHKSRIRPFWCLVKGVEELRRDGTYYRRVKRDGKLKWESLGNDANAAYTMPNGSDMSRPQRSAEFSRASLGRRRRNTDVAARLANGPRPPRLVGKSEVIPARVLAKRLKPKQYLMPPNDRSQCVLAAPELGT